MIKAGDSQHVAATDGGSKVVFNLGRLGSVWHKVRRGNRVRVNRGITKTGVGRDDVVVEIADLMLVAKVFADIGQRPVFHYADSLFDFVD